MSPRANLGGARKATERQGGLQRSSRSPGGCDTATGAQAGREGWAGCWTSGSVGQQTALRASSVISRLVHALRTKPLAYTRLASTVPHPAPVSLSWPPLPHSLSSSTFAHACACTSRRLCFRPALATPPVPRPRSPPALLLLTHCVPRSQKSWRRRPQLRVVSVLQTKLFARAGFVRAVPSAASVG